ncbi:MAG: HepT-like ribonuclease domain-containing protein [Bryobacteraceae bacterium]
MQDGRAAFLLDTKTRDAVVRNLEIAGEAVKHLSSNVRELTRKFRDGRSRACGISSSMSILA